MAVGSTTHLGVPGAMLLKDYTRRGTVLVELSQREIDVVRDALGSYFPRKWTDPVARARMSMARDLDWKLLSAK